MLPVFVGKLIRLFKWILRGLQSRVHNLLYLKKIEEHNLILEKYKERRVSYGENYPDKTFYVVYIRYAVNICSLIKSLIPYFLYAEKQGWIPIVDQRTYDFTFLGVKPEDKSDDNVWEYFFEQPAGYTLENIKNAKNIVLCNPLTPPAGYVIPNEIRDLSNDAIKVFNQYIRLKTETKEKIKSIADTFKRDEQKKCIGVNLRLEMLRGALVNSSLYYNHMYSSKEQIFEAFKDIKKSFNSNSYDIFLCCDDFGVGNKLLTMLRPFVAASLERKHCNKSFFVDGDIDKPLDDKSLYNMEWASFSEQIEIFYEYFASIYLFSRCDIVYCGENDSAVFMAMLLKGKVFDQIHFIKQQRFHPVYNDSKLYLHEDENGYLVLH